MSISRRVSATIIGVALLAASAVVPSHAARNKGNSYRAQVAATYLGRNQNDDGSIPGFSAIGGTADGVIASVAANTGARTVRRGIRYLREHVADASNVGEKGKIVIAAVAAGADPRNFGGRDLVAEIASSIDDDGSLGGESNAEVFYQALGLLGLAAAGEGIQQSAIDWLIDAQCEDGGWQFDEPAEPNDDEHCVQSGNQDDFDRSNTDTTAMAIMALKSFNSTGGVAHDPIAFFDSTRDPEHGGWGYEPAFITTSSPSTALVIQAHVAMGLDLPQGALGALRALQYPRCGKSAGAFAFTYDEDGNRGDPEVGTTANGIMGLLKQALPVAPGELHDAPTFPRRCG